MRWRALPVRWGWRRSVPARRPWAEGGAARGRHHLPRGFAQPGRGGPGGAITRGGDHRCCGAAGGASTGGAGRSWGASNGGLARSVGAQWSGAAWPGGGGAGPCAGRGPVERGCALVSLGGAKQGGTVRSRWASSGWCQRGAGASDSGLARSVGAVGWASTGWAGPGRAGLCARDGRAAAGAGGARGRAIAGWRGRWGPWAGRALADRRRWGVAAGWASRLGGEPGRGRQPAAHGRWGGRASAGWGARRACCGSGRANRWAVRAKSAGWALGGEH